MKDLDQESLKAIEYQNQVQALLKKIEFLRHEHELVTTFIVKFTSKIIRISCLLQEVTQMRTQPVSVINTVEYQNELAAAIREIRKEFDELAKQNKVDLESWYTRKVSFVLYS